jgi:hypothetical protein
MLPQSVDSPDLFDQSETAMPRPDQSRRDGRFRSLRLSVRTPPFHGGESGSIPLGSAIVFNGLASETSRTPDIRPIYPCGWPCTFLARYYLRVISSSQTTPRCRELDERRKACARSPQVSAGLATGEPQELVEWQTATEVPLMAAEGRRP